MKGERRRGGKYRKIMGGEVERMDGEKRMQMEINGPYKSNFPSALSGKKRRQRRNGGGGGERNRCLVWVHQ